MRLYLVVNIDIPASTGDKISYCIMAARNPKEASELHPLASSGKHAEAFKNNSPWASSPKFVNVSYFGQAPRHHKPKVILLGRY